MSASAGNAAHMDSMTEKPNGLHALIGTTLRLRSINPAFRAAVAAGIDEYQEHRAYGYVLPYVEDSRNNTAYLRAAGLVASFPSIAQSTERTPLGRSLAQLTMKRSKKWPDPSAMDAVAKRVMALPDQDLEEASMTIRRLLALAEGQGVAFDFHAIAKLLTRWGNGFSETSLKVRQSTVSSYWQGNNAPAADNAS